jgi:ParB family chromosome partitioning protein
MSEIKPETKRKSFFVPKKSMGTAIEESIKAVENHSGNMRFEVISLKRIEPDPQNPRELKLSMSDIYNGVNSTEPFYLEKQRELEELKHLSETIASKGLINPIVVYKHGEFYRLVAGERRFLASILAKKEDIQAKILPSKPTQPNLRILQWIENSEREDLSLRDRIGNIRSILDEYKKENPNVEITSSVLQKLAFMSSSNSANYLSLLNAPDDIKELINLGKINSINKAVFISSIKEESIRREAINSCISGETLSNLKNAVKNEEKIQSNNVSRVKVKKLGRAFKQVNLGKTVNTFVVKKIIHDVINQTQKLKNFELRLLSIDWESYDDTTKIFREFFNLLEKEGS